MICFTRGIALFESLVALLLFSFLFIISSQALHFLGQWHSQLIMHRLASHQLENLSDVMQGSLIDEKHFSDGLLKWSDDNKKLNSRFSSHFHCQSTRCTVRLTWSSRDDIQQGQSACYFLFDSCVQLEFSVKHQE